ncbi:conserved unknown protein [Ectocarpus siliculosus]|uniref:LRAT domain-containing protein n=1 Tax=Ectocarpus siliculosus TaxID=2880 RepID=D8LNF0_ECTSI|nr:conserved unknown protein [Ectocarpus siliculosus]|eukprot:CBN77307.1 conserved unknown protein [Ectocarpus siliculosus]
MAEMEEMFTDSTKDNDSTLGANDPELELQRWQQWRNVDLARTVAPPTGSSTQPIEIDCAGTADNNTALAGGGEEERTAGGPEGDAPVAATEGETLWGHAVHEHELSAGDQVYVYRGVIQHHGIVTHVPVPGRAGGVRVVHFDSNCDGVESTSLETFLNGGTLRRATYGASAWSTGLDYGASYGCATDDPALIVTRATEAAKFGEGASGWSGYNLCTNNCETFAYWCSTGRRQVLSRQAARGLVGAGVVAAGASAVVSAGGFASAGAAATVLVPRGVRGVQRGVKAIEWATGVAVVAVAAADVVSTLVTRAPVERNLNLRSGSTVAILTDSCMHLVGRLGCGRRGARPFL